MPVEPVLPLVDRPSGAVLARRDGAPVTVARFLADVAHLAAGLPEPGGAPAHAVNLCTGRYAATVAFAAALCRGHVTLLSSDRTPRRLAELAAEFPGAFALADAAVPDAPVPVLRVGEAPPGAAAPNPAIPADRLAAIAFTSGSTGRPAPHRKPWGALVAAAAAAAERFGMLDESDPAAIVATVPPQHMYGFETSVMLPLQGACAAHSGADFYPADVARALDGSPGRRVLVTTPLQLRALLGALGNALPPLAAVISATAPLGTELAAAAEAAWGAPVLEIYGATEVGSLASRRTTSGELWLPYRGVALRVAEEDAFAAVPGLPELRLSDTLDLAGGAFRLLGRRADVVKLAGRRTSLGFLNRVLTSIAGVRDGVFVAPEDLERNPGARLAAFVVAPSRSPAEIVAALRGEVEPVFLPRPVVMLDNLPRDAVGKLRHAELAGLRRHAALRPQAGPPA